MTSVAVLMTFYLFIVFHSGNFKIFFNKKYYLEAANVIERSTSDAFQIKTILGLFDKKVTEESCEYSNSPMKVLLDGNFSVK